MIESLGVDRPRLLLAQTKATSIGLHYNQGELDILTARPGACCEPELSASRKKRRSLSFCSVSLCRGVVLHPSSCHARFHVRSVLETVRAE